MSLCPGPDSLNPLYISLSLLAIILILFGFYGSFWCVCIWFRNIKEKTPINTLLFGLACCDSYICTLLALKWVFRFACIFNEDSEFMKHIENNARYYFVMTMCIGFTGTSFLTVAIAIERFIVVMWPLKASGWITLKRSKLIALCIPISVVILHIPINLIPYTTGVRIFYQTVCFILPLTCVLVLNSVITYKIQEYNRKRAELTKSESKKLVTTKMLWVVNFVYFLCCIFVTFSLCADSGRLLISSTSGSSGQIQLGVELCMILNASTNYIIYCYFDKRFRHSLNLLACRRFDTSGLNSSST